MNNNKSNRYDAYGDVLTVDEVSCLLGSSRQCVYRLVQTGKLRAFRLGRGYKIPKISVIEFLEGKHTSIAREDTSNGKP